MIKQGRKGFSASLFFIVVFFVLYGTALFSHADTTERRIEEEKRKKLEWSEFHPLKGGGRFLIDYGAWIDFRYINYKDDDNDASTEDTLRESYEADNRFWLKVNVKPPVGADYENEHILYFRLKDLYIKRFPEDTTGDYDHEGPHLDYGYGIFDYDPYKLEIGRRYFNVGRGIAYSNVNDGLKVNFLRSPWNVGALFARSLPHEDNIDASVPGFDKDSDRYFFALGVGYAGIREHQFYGYYLGQRDFSDERPVDPDQQYTYDSDYFGIGAKGNLNKQWDYWFEVIKQGGQGRIFGTNEKSKVDALGANIGTAYQVDFKQQPRVVLEYAYGSGDTERTAVTDTQGGNLNGKDNNFLYFGYFPAGYALAPRLSNIHIYRAGASVRPFAQWRWMKELLLETDYFWYFKDKPEGGISDTEATVNSDDIGSEFDVTVSWQILSDLSWSLTYGYFMPGEAFTEGADDSDQYFSQSLTFTF